MHPVSARWSWSGVVRAALPALGYVMGCAQVLGLPSDPELVSETPPALDEAGAQPPGSVPLGSASEMAPASSGMTASGGPREQMEAPSLVESQTDPSASDRSSSDLPPLGLDAGPSGGDDAGAAEPAPEGACPGPSAPPLVDIVMIVDNSGSMVATTAEAERALPRFALRLEQGQVDYRIILISRHRIAARAASTEASTSVCIPTPLSGLPLCPAARPALAPRFFQYSIKIDASDSFQRVLEAAITPDPFELTSAGWLEWLRPGARIEFVEVSDADSDVSGEAFVSGLAARAPEHFAATMTDPGFVFHSIIGAAGRVIAGDVYRPDEPIQTQICARLGGNPDNAGEIYQALSRATGGLRQPVCPAVALGTRLDVIAADVVARSASACASN
jgi:hypothetical protein